MLVEVVVVRTVEVVNMVVGGVVLMEVDGMVVVRYLSMKEKQCSIAVTSERVPDTTSS